MAVRGDEVAGSIDAQVRESIEKMVAEIHSSIEDVRVAVDQQLRAALQSVQADVNSVTFLPQIRSAIGSLEETFGSTPEAAPAAPPAVPGAVRVRNAVQAIERGKSQVDVLNSLLEQCLEFGSRAALLILRGDTFSGWKGAGFSAHGGNDELIKRFNAAPGNVAELDRVVRDEQVVASDGAEIAARFGVTAPDSAVLVPMVIKDKVAAAVYVDAIGDDVSKFDQPAIELLVFTTGLLIDTLTIRKKIPSPSLSTGSGVETPAPPRTRTPEVAAAKAEPAAPAPETEPEPEETPVPVRTDAGTIAIDGAQLREQIAAERPSFNPPPLSDFSGAMTPPAPAPAPPPAPAAASPSGSGEERPSTQYIPPPGVGRGGVLGGGGGENSKKHDEARRFARLLVSEIKLYNESKVEQGRKNHDLYERLKEDIDRSRQMYDERISDDVRKESNYFYDELVRILADGKADALGL